MIGGLAGVIIISLLIGLLLNLLYRMSQYVFPLFFVVMLFPEIISMPRGDLLGWFSVLVRTCLFVAVLYLGWKVYPCMAWLKQGPRYMPQLNSEQLPGS